VRLRSVAEMRGQDPEDALLALLNQPLTDAEVEDELIAELGASVENHAAEHSMTIEKYRAKALVKRQDQRESR
jgi:hypothetical protein